MLLKKPLFVFKLKFREDPVEFLKYGAAFGFNNEKELNKVKEAIIFARNLGLKTNAGHGLDYKNIKPIAKIPGIEQFHIGHSIISKAVMIGIQSAVQEMKNLI